MANLKVPEHHETGPVFEETDLKEEFGRLAHQWYEDTAKLSIVQQMAMHPA